MEQLQEKDKASCTIKNGAAEGNTSAGLVVHHQICTLRLGKCREIITAGTVYSTLR